MTQENKELLLRDLCTRIPYGVKILIPSWDEREMEYVDRVDTLYSVNDDNYVIATNDYYDFCVEDVKPYLFPLLSMTEEQKEIYRNFFINPLRGLLTPQNSIELFDWLNKNHIDYRDLIEKGLAIDATGLNIY